MVLEWFCGIGGFSFAFPHLCAVGIDVNRNGLETFEANFQSTCWSAQPQPAKGHFHCCADITTIDLTAQNLANADGWWMSPPCQPFTSRGQCRDHEDPRSRALLRLLQLIPVFQPNWLALENVPGFGESKSREMLIEQLQKVGYKFREYLICPTEAGIPNRRQRYYLVASQSESPLPVRFDNVKSLTLADFVDRSCGNVDERELEVSQQLVDAYRSAMHIIQLNQQHEIANCFTSAYGNSPVRAGSYLEFASSVRRFSPLEIARLLGFPDSFFWPTHLSLRQKWKLIGNSISVFVVRELLSQSIPAIFHSNRD